MPFICLSKFETIIKESFILLDWKPTFLAFVLFLVDTGILNPGLSPGSLRSDHIQGTYNLFGESTDGIPSTMINILFFSFFPQLYSGILDK